MALKTYQAWKGSLDTYLQINDEVDQEMIDYAIGVLPPATHNNFCIQIGEPYDTCLQTGKFLFTTFEKVAGKWIYKGHLTKRKG